MLKLGIESQTAEESFRFKIKSERRKNKKRCGIDRYYSLKIERQNGHKLAPDIDLVTPHTSYLALDKVGQCAE